jgi:hypothetical protein|eukprot:SAG25_NODE_182_length_12512_cov_80.886732_9_plen_54_part_00
MFLEDYTLFWQIMGASQFAIVLFIGMTADIYSFARPVHRTVRLRVSIACSARD